MKDAGPKKGKAVRKRAASAARTGATKGGGRKAASGRRTPGPPESTFRMMVENANEAILVAQDERLTFVNPKGVDLLGYTRRELTSRPFIEFIHPDDQKMVVRRHRQRLGGRKLPQVYPCRLVDRNGRIRWVEINVVLFSWQRRPATLIFLNDIGRRKRAQEALRESEEKYRQLFATESDAIIVFYADTGRFIDVNDAALRLYGYDRKEFLKLRVTDISAEPEETWSVVQGTVAGNLSRIPLRYHRKKDGTRFPVETSTSTFMLRGRKVLCGAVRDITRRKRMEVEIQRHRAELEKLVEERTAKLKKANQKLRKEIHERKRIEKALREGERKYSTLVENSLIGIYIDQDERIVFANQRMADIYGYPYEDILGIESWRLVHPDDREWTNEIRSRRLRGEEAPTEYEARGVTRDGQTLWIKRRNTQIGYQGRPAILGNAVDISERKRAEEELRKANEELKSFLHVVSHDLKNPIISIQGFSARLIRDYRERLEDKGRRYLFQIQSSARRMEALVSDLLTLSKVGILVSNYEEVPIREVVDAVLEGLEDRARRKRVKIVIADDLPTIRCDRDRLCQVFDNLLSNALKFMGVTKAPRIEIAYANLGDAHRFSIRDNGIGIHSRHHKKFFEMFHRLKDVEDEEGTGLGLAIVERIVAGHGGKVWVESERGKGATFFFTLPKSP